MTVQSDKHESERKLAFWYMLRRTYLTILRARQRELSRYGMSAEAAGVLHAIVRLQKEATPTSIAEQLSLERNSVSEQLKRMEKDGLIERVKDLDRKNRVRVSLTVKGHQAYLRSSRNRSTLRIVSALSLEEQRQAWLLLARLQTKAISQTGVKRPKPYPAPAPEDFS